MGRYGDRNLISARFEQRRKEKKGMTKVTSCTSAAYHHLRLTSRLCVLSPSGCTSPHRFLIDMVRRPATEVGR